MFYNPSWVYSFPNELLQKSICINKKEILKFTSNKMLMRLWLSNDAKILKYKYLTKNECGYKDIKNLFPKYVEFVIQSSSGSGGINTFLMNEKNEEEVLTALNNKELYMVSPYYENNIPINVHAMIFKDNFQIFNPSIQIIVNEDNRLAYKGADFIQYQNIDAKLKEKVKNMTSIICTKLQKIGYLGVCGFDFIICNDKVYFIEMNNRFQNSSLLLNKGLVENGYPTLQELNIDAFNKDSNKLNFSKLKVDYALYIYDKSDKHLCVFDENIILDGFKEDSALENGCYCYTKVFKKSICNISKNNKTTVDIINNHD